MAQKKEMPVWLGIAIIFCVVLLAYALFVDPGVIAKI